MPSTLAHRAVLPLLALLVALVACGGSETPPASTPEASSPPPAQTPAPESGDGGFEPLTSRSGQEGERLVTAGASWAMPSAWVREAPSSSMRLAQARLPGEAGDAEMTLFHFGPGGGGDAESNIVRWLGQVELDAGTAPIRETFEQGPYRIQWVEALGTLLPSTMGTGPDAPQPGSALLGAVVEGPGGPWFLKITGPASTVKSHGSAFVDMLRSVEPAG